MSILDKFSPFVKCFTSLLVYLSNIPLLRENPAKVKYPAIWKILVILYLT
nr:MAG TPA: hypothetical protein [Caudoviricetes sp.]